MIGMEGWYTSLGGMSRKMDPNGLTSTYAVAFPISANPSFPSPTLNPITLILCDHLVAFVLYHLRWFSKQSNPNSSSKSRLPVSPAS